MKKVLVLLGTYRKQNTYNIIQQIEEILNKNDISMEIVHLNKYDIKNCVGCECCINTNKCNIKDETEIIIDKMISSDGIILASPVYLLQVSGMMKTFIDRTCKIYHRPLLIKKPVLSVVTTKGSGLKNTSKYLTSVGLQWGMMDGGNIGRSIFNIDKKVEIKELKKYIHLLDQPSDYHPKLKELIDFEIQKSLAVYLKGLDLDYWQSNKLLGAYYFFPCKINIFKRGISQLVGQIVRNKMK
ncbi:MAG: flavodoxin family protein [Erysipelotrichaceae bacterium]